MQWDDILDDNKNDALNLNDAMNCNELLEFKQALLSKKKNTDKTVFSVNHEYINSPEYHTKFEKIDVNKNVQESLYKQSGRLLEFIESLDTEKQFQERLLAIDAKTGELIVDNFSRDGEVHRTGFTIEEHQKLENCPNQIIYLHNHSLNGPPSAQDILTCLHNDKAYMSVIICHNGDIYTISDIKPEFEEQYEKYLETRKQRTNDIVEARCAAVDDTCNYNDSLSEKRQFIKIKRL